MIKSLQNLSDELKISVSTVSRALSGHPGVSEATRKKVIELAGRYGYVPDPAASALRTGKGYGLTIILPLARPEIAAYRAEYLMAMGRREFGSTKVITLNANENINSAILSAASEKSQAIICAYINQEISTEIIDMLKSQKIPLTMIDSSVNGLDNIRINRRSGTCQMARMLLLTGCKSPVFLSGTDFDNPDDRLKGIMAGYKSLGKELDRNQVIKIYTGNNPLKCGYETAETILKTRYADAIFGYSDMVTIGVVRALTKAGVKIPAEIKIVGFDNLPLAEYMPIPFTTVAQPIDELVETAVRMTRERLDKFDLPVREQVFKTQLIIRESAPVPEHSMKSEIFEILKDIED